MHDGLFPFAKKMALALNVSFGVFLASPWHHEIAEEPMIFEYRPISHVPFLTKSSKDLLDWWGERGSKSDAFLRI